jgi:photosystem II stability/assembly factor-like uncharacterized protein
MSLCFVNVKSQENSYSDNYFEYYNYMMNYFQGKAAELNIPYYEVDGWKDFKRWVLYFENKYDETGFLGSYPVALAEYYANIVDFLPEELPEWEYIGHDGIYPQLINGQYNCSVGQGNITTIWVDKNNLNYIFAGGNFGSLWRTTNGGLDWDCISETNPLIKGVCSIDVNPNNHDIIYITSAPGRQGGEGYSFGLFKTINGGITWDNIIVNIPGTGHLYPSTHPKFKPVKWIVNPNDPLKMFLITWGKLLRSLDGGDNWQMLKDLEYDYWWNELGFKDIEFDPDNSSIVYASGVDVFKLTENGNIIEEITDEITQYTLNTSGNFKILIGTKKQNNNIWFAVKSYDNGNDNLVIYNKNTGLASPIYEQSSLFDKWKMQCEVSPLNDGHILIGGISTKLFVAENPIGQKIKTISICDPTNNNWTHVDVRDAKYLKDENGNEVIYVGNDGSVFKTTYRPASQDWLWSYLGNDGSNGIRNGELHGFDCSNSTEDILYEGLQDMGSALRLNNSWYYISGGGGDGGPGLIDKTNPNYAYLTSWNSPAVVYRWIYSGTWSFSDFFHTNDHSKPPIEMNLNNGNEIFIGEQYRLQKFLDARTSNSHTPILDIPADGYDPGKLFINEIAVGVSNPLVIFTSTDRYFGYSNNPPPTHEKSIYKTNNGGLTWIDLSENLINALIGGPVTGIAINPFNENEVWTCFGTTATDPDPTKNKKVYHTINGGTAWTPMAQGLPENIPVNDIKFERNSGILYLVNDVGIYYYDNLDDLWYNITNDGPKSMCLSKIQFNYGLNKIRIGTFGRGIWQTDIPCVYHNTPQHIDQSITWSSVKHIYSDIVIEPSCTLTITNKVFLPEDAKIIVKPGAKLKLNGGILTNACEGLWRGIEVWGHINQPQHPSCQGWVEIINNGTIENALFGIRTIHAEDDEISEVEILDATSSGGIVFANNARFVNNKTAVRFYSYPQSSISNFYECEFETNANVLGGVTPDYFMWIDHISGVDITDCWFNNNTGTDYFHSGIYARDATFYIEGKCLAGDPCNTWENGWFRKLNYGVYVVNTNTIYYPDIRHTDFSLNKRGIYISTTDGARVTSCKFYLPVVGTTISDYYGLYLNNSFAYHIEDNDFIGPNPNLGGFGVYINNSGQHWNQIYNNRFSWLNYGTYAYGLNRVTQGLQINVGLCIECNDYDYNKNDIYVNGLMGTNHGIAKYQGQSTGSNDTLPAGNTFTQNYSGLVYNYRNNKSMAFIEYAYHGINNTNEKLIPEPYYSPMYMIRIANQSTQYNKSIACPSKLNVEGGGHDFEGMEEAVAQIEQKETQLEALVDGGNTFVMNMEVISSTPPEAVEIYQDLMNESPFLSDTIMKSAINKENVLPNAMVRDVLVANPQSAKNAEVMEAVDERFEPMPEWMKEQVMLGVNIIGAKETIESEIAKWQNKHAEHFNNLYQHFRKDTLNQQASADSLEKLLSLDNRLESKYRLAFFYLNKGDVVSAGSILFTISSSFNFAPVQQTVHQEYLSLFSVLTQLNGNLPAEGSPEESALELLATDEENYPGACARNLLYAAGLIEYEEPIILPEDELKSSEAVDHELSNHTGKPETLKVFPNPAGDYVIVEYDTEGYSGNISISVIDITGRKVFINNYSIKCDQIVVKTREWASGIYQINVLINGKVIKSEKVTVK